MFCQNCGSQLGPDAKFCPSCGTAVQIPPAAQEPAKTIPMPGPEAQAPYTPPVMTPGNTAVPPPVRTPITTSPAASAKEPFLKTACYVLCVLGIVCFFLNFVLPIFSIPGFALSILALVGSGQKEKGNGRLLAKAFSILGIILNGLVFLAVIVLSLALVLD